MDQSKSSSKSAEAMPLRKRSFSMEFFVGLFTLIGVLALGYMSVSLAGLDLGTTESYEIIADFDNISGLEVGASVEIAGVPIGTVTKIYLTDPSAKVVLRIGSDVKLKDDDIASIRTKGIIGDRYVKISRGASSTLIPAGGLMTETESVVDIEDIIGKIVHSMTSDDKDEDKSKSDAATK